MQFAPVQANLMQIHCSRGLVVRAIFLLAFAVLGLAAPSRAQVQPACAAIHCPDGRWISCHESCYTPPPPPPPDPIKIKQRALFDEGKKEFKDEHWSKAIELFEKALECGPDPEISNYKKEAQDRLNQQETESLEGLIPNLQKRVEASKSPSSLSVMKSAPPQTASGLPIMKLSDFVPRVLTVPANARLVPAEAELVFAAKRQPVMRGYTYDEIESTRHELVTKLLEFRLKGYDLLLTNASAIGEAVILRKPGGSPEPEEMLRDVESLAREYFELRMKYGEMIGEPSPEQRRNAYIRSLKFEDSGNYSVVASDSTARSPGGPPPCHDEIETKYEKRMWGPPINKVDYDIVVHHHKVCP